MQTGRQCFETGQVLHCILIIHPPARYAELTDHLTDEERSQHRAWNMNKPTTILLTTLLFLSALSVHAQTVAIDIDTGTRYQTVKGFGGFLKIIPWWLKWENYSQANKERLFVLLANDLRIRYLRLPFPAGIEAENDNNDPQRLDLSRFDPYRISWRENDTGKYDGEVNVDIYALQQLWQRGVRHLLMSTWSPAAWLKDSQTVYGGRIKPELREEYAEMIAGTVLSYRARLGIEIGYISLYNEPEFFVGYAHTEARPEEFRALLPIVKTRLIREGLTTKIFGPEPGDPKAEFFGTNWIPDDRLASIDIFAFHHYPRFFNDYPEIGRLQEVGRVARERGKPAWQTEISNLQSSGGDISRADTFDEGLALGQHLHNALVHAGVEVWTWWKLYDFHPTQAYGGRPAAQRLIYINPDNGQPNPSPKYYAMRQFSRFITSGSARVRSQSSNQNVLVSAYRHENGNTTIIVINKESSSRQIAVTLSAGDSGEMQVYEFSSQVNGRNTGAVTMQNGRFSYRVSGRSITTFFAGDLQAGDNQPQPDRSPPRAPSNVRIRLQEN